MMHIKCRLKRAKKEIEKIHVKFLKNILTIKGHYVVDIIKFYHLKRTKRKNNHKYEKLKLWKIISKTFDLILFLRFTAHFWYVVLSIVTECPRISNHD